MLAIDLETADRCAEVGDQLRRADTPITENDVWITALACQHELPLVSRDEPVDQVPVSTAAPGDGASRVGSEPE